ncbi:MAG: hypothetical protein M0Q91_17975 [Methanoregula sp.]|nr:hypothetical protein [Methanoregula sp.]
MIDPELKKEFRKIRDAQRFTMLLVLAAILFLLFVPQTHAQTITITNSAGNSLRDINVYYPNATTGQMDYFGRYNTTSVITTDGNVSYTFDLVPMESNPLTDPTDWINNQAIPFVQSNLIGLIAIMFFIGLIYAGRK